MNERKGAGVRIQDSVGRESPQFKKRFYGFFLSL